MAIMIDWKQGHEHSLSPFFGAGTAKAVDWIHRDEGLKTNAAGLVDDMDEIGNQSAGKTAVLSANISGIAGYTKFQGSVSLVEIPV
jgi:hypothetical protein